MPAASRQPVVPVNSEPPVTAKREAEIAMVTATASFDPPATTGTTSATAAVSSRAPNPAHPFAGSSATSAGERALLAGPGSQAACPAGSLRPAPAWQ